MYTQVWAVLFRLNNVEQGSEFQNVLVGRVREVKLEGYTWTRRLQGRGPGPCAARSEALRISRPLRLTSRVVIGPFTPNDSSMLMICVQYTRPSHRGSEVYSPGAINPYVAPCGSSPVALEHSATLPRPFSLGVLYSMRSEIDCIAAREFPLCREIDSAIGVRLDHHTVLSALPDDLRSRVEKRFISRYCVAGNTGSPGSIEI